MVLSAAFFAAAHLVNVLFRSNPFLVSAQAVGAFSDKCMIRRPSG